MTLHDSCRVTFHADSTAGVRRRYHHRAIVTGVIYGVRVCAQALRFFRRSGCHISGSGRADDCTARNAGGSRLPGSQRLRQDRGCRAGRTAAGRTELHRLPYGRPAEPHQRQRRTGLERSRFAHHSTIPPGISEQPAQNQTRHDDARSIPCLSPDGQGGGRGFSGAFSGVAGRADR